MPSEHAGLGPASGSRLETRTSHAVCTHLSRLDRGVRERIWRTRVAPSGLPISLQPAEELLPAPVETPRRGHSGPPTHVHHDGQNLGRLWVQPPLQERQVTPASPLHHPGAETEGTERRLPRHLPGAGRTPGGFPSAASGQKSGVQMAAHTRAPGATPHWGLRVGPHPPRTAQGLAATSRWLAPAAVRVASSWSDDA